MANDRFGPIDFDRFHLEDLPARFANRPRVLTASDSRALRPLAFSLPDGRSYTYAPSGDGISIAPGDADAHTVVTLSYEDWCAFAWELRSCFALFYADALAFPRGSFGHLARWEPSLRVAFDGQAIYDLDDPAPVTDEDGGPLDLHRTFSLDDPDAELVDFLERAGFVHLRGVVDSTELEQLRADVATAIARARPDDKRSWWTTVDGVDTCNRVNYLNDQSDLIAGLGADERFRRIGALGGPDLRDAPDRLDGNGVVIKVPGATSGLVDLPWHRDCGMGGHPVKCPMLNIGIQLDAATSAAGQLLVLAGSHRGTSRLPGPDQTDGLPVVALTTEPGDVTIHFGHTLHAAPPPTDPSAAGRRALYLSFVPPLTFEMIGPGLGYNDVLFTRHSGHVQHVDALR
ncbi:MAG TPA: phytanoyl-CoA dioxygenase family protein [Acidimicrobiales bacterium]|nr:phytanoyl-CoA dioxygenase family protein [Acidimicrobiales bacterium]